MLYKFFRSLFTLLFKIFFRLEVYGRENIPLEGGFILASNHSSFLDPVVLGVASPRILNFMARDDLFKPRVFSSLIDKLGAFPVKRNKTDISAIKEAINRLREGLPILIFPEGTRSQNGKLQHMRLGMGLLAREAKVPIVPVYVEGTQSVLPKDKRRLKLKKVKVHFGNSIYAGDDDYPKIANRVAEQIHRLSR